MEKDIKKEYWWRICFISNTYWNNIAHLGVVGMDKDNVKYA